ncbi:hypothetical protein, partial [Enterococcus faecium]
LFFEIVPCDSKLNGRLTTSSLNGVLLPTPRSQVTIFNKHEKLFFEIVPCDSELNGRLTTSFLNGVQKLASAVISSTKRKIGGAIFVWLFLLLDAGQLFHNLFSFSTTFP